jgi:hypothetical protein
MALARPALFLLLLVAAAPLSGCAAVFRDAKSEVAFNSSPPGAAVTIRGHGGIATPSTVEVSRNGSTDVLVQAPGYEDHRGVVRKSLNGAWVTIDVITCVFPVALCIPLLVDAVTGAWTDVEPTYDVTLKPATGPTAPGTVPGTNGAPVIPGGPIAPSPAKPTDVPTGTGPEISL